MSSVRDPKPLPGDGDASTRVGPRTTVQHGDTSTRASADRPQLQPLTAQFDVEDTAAVAAVPDSGPERLYMTGWRLYVLTFASVLSHFRSRTQTY